jgi:hypothetical protein
MPIMRRLLRFLPVLPLLGAVPFALPFGTYVGGAIVTGFENGWVLADRLGARRLGGA